MTPKLAVLLFSLAGLTSCASPELHTLASRSDTESNSLWCHQGWQEPDGGPNDWKELKKDAFHVVKSDLQPKAIDSLSRRSFVELKPKAAEKFLREGESLQDGRIIYLVRAAAPNLDGEYNPICKACGPIPMAVSHSPSRKTLAVSSYSLGNPTPQNLAIMVEAPGAISEVKGRCLSAM